MILKQLNVFEKNGIVLRGIRRKLTGLVVEKHNNVSDLVQSL